MDAATDLARAALAQDRPGAGVHFHDDRADDVDLSRLVIDLYAAGFPAVARRLERDWAALRLTTAASVRYLEAAQTWKASSPDNLTTPT